MPRWVKCKRATFKYGLGEEFIDVLKTLHKLGLDRTEKVKVGGVEVSPRDVVAACLPNPATLGPDDARQDLRRAMGDRHRQGRQPALDLPLPRRRQPVVDGRVRPPVRGVADRHQSRCGAGTSGQWHMERQRRARPGGIRLGAVPRAADRLRLTVGPSRTSSATTVCLRTTRRKCMCICVRPQLARGRTRQDSAPCQKSSPPSRPPRGSRPPTRWGCRSAPASRRRSCARWASARTGQTCGCTARCSRSAPNCSRALAFTTCRASTVRWSGRCGTWAPTSSSRQRISAASGRCSSDSRRA